MNFPLFHLEHVGGPLLIAVIAVLHVFINHPLAVGIIPYIAWMEWRGRSTGESEWDDLGRRTLAFVFVITTTVGAMTGVGIWFATSLVNPDAIGSLIRVFFWGWFTEWIIFVLEVVFIMTYYLTWKPWTQRTEPFVLNLGPAGKARLDPKATHLGFGIFLAIFSWLTMAIIVGILGFMMTSGAWTNDTSLLSGFFNPLYLPQLFFRTPFALTAAGLVVLALIPFFVKRESPLRGKAIRATSTAVLLFLPWTLFGGVVYWWQVPRAMIDNLPVALTTQYFTEWHQTVLYLLGAAVLAILVIATWGAIKPRLLPRVALIVPICLAVVLLGYFERVREFIRKPYVIQNYMYSNGIRVADYPLLKEEGILTHATYTMTPVITMDNRLLAGEEVFRLACTRCHTDVGILAVRKRLVGLYGNEAPWEQQTVASYIRGMHNARPFMPPFPGTEAELDALVLYLRTLQEGVKAEEVMRTAPPLEPPEEEPAQTADAGITASTEEVSG